MGSRACDFIDLEADEVSSVSSFTGDDEEDSDEVEEGSFGSPVCSRVQSSDSSCEGSSQERLRDDGGRFHVDAGGRASPTGTDPLGRSNGRRGRPVGASNRPVHERGERLPRFRGTTFFLTGPQCGSVSVSAALGHVSGFNDFEWACAVLEHHSDGSPHLHLAVRFLQPRDFTSPQYFDFDGLHWNIRVVKNRRVDVERVLKYIGKEAASGRPDANRPQVKHYSKVLTYEELLVMFTKAQGTAQVVAQMIKDGATTDELLRNDSVSGWMLMNLARVSTYRTAVTQAAQHVRLESWDLSILKSYQCRSSRAQYCWGVIMSWLEYNIRVPKDERPHRPRQLWIVSMGGAGKSLLVRHLSKMLRVYFFPKETRFHCLWEADVDLIVADDVMIPIYDFLSWADGTTMTIEKKGGMTRKEGSYPFLMLSNNPPWKMYDKCSPATLDALAGSARSRFHVLEWPDHEGLPVPDFTSRPRWEAPADPSLSMPSVVEQSLGRHLARQAEFEARFSRNGFS